MRWKKNTHPIMLLGFAEGKKIKNILIPYQDLIVLNYSSNIFPPTTQMRKYAGD